VDWADLWRFRDLFLVMEWHDIAVRYQQTVLGILWAILQLVITIVVFTLTFNRVGTVQSAV
jgi:lipopolysaccharide transport system permease protein